MYLSSEYACEGLYAPLEFWNPNRDRNTPRRRLCRLRKRLSPKAPPSTGNILTFEEVHDADRNHSDVQKDSARAALPTCTGAALMSTDLSASSAASSRRRWRAVFDQQAAEAATELNDLERRFGVLAPLVAVLGAIVGFILF